MGGKPQPAGFRDKLDRALWALKAIWFGLFANGLILLCTLAAIIMSGGGVNANLGEVGYLFLLAVPLGLLGAYVIAPVATTKDPATVARATGTKRTKAMFAEWEGTNPDDPFYWFPIYASGFFIRASILEGAAIICAVGLFVTANWVVLGGAAVMLAALAAQMPSRAAAEAFAEEARTRAANT